MKLKNLWYINYIYLEYLFNNIKYLTDKAVVYKTQYFSVYLHKKLNYFLISIFNKFFNYSNGQLLKHKIKQIKYFKKSKKSYGYTINILNKSSKKNINSINYFYCKNFNLRNYNWLKKFFIIINPDINYFICTNSWNYINLKKKRIKKKIYRNLIKNSKLV
jgi:hypothetical protein